MRDCARACWCPRPTGWQRLSRRSQHHARAGSPADGSVFGDDQNVAVGQTHVVETVGRGRLQDGPVVSVDGLQVARAGEGERVEAIQLQFV